MRSANSCPTRTAPTKACSRSRTTTSSGCSLRYDLTAPLARYVAENFETLPKPYRSYRAGYVFRNEKPGPGRFRQFMQFDADTVGSASPAADAEMCMMAADTMEALGIARGAYSVIKVNNRKVLDGVMEAIGLGGEENAMAARLIGAPRDRQARSARRSTACANCLAPDGRTKAAISPRARASTTRKSKIETFVNARGLVQPPLLAYAGDADVRRGLSAILTRRKTNTLSRAGSRTCCARRCSESSSQVEGLDELVEIARLVDAAGYRDQIVVDPSVVRGLEYYTGPVFEAELLAEIPNEKGQPVVFGSVGGGGRYDGLVSRFRGEPVPATGFSIGVSRLQAALTCSASSTRGRPSGPVVVTVFDRDRVADYQKMVAQSAQRRISAPSSISAISRTWATS